MLGMSHVILHLGLCSAVARLGPEATVDMRVRFAYRGAGGNALDKPIRFTRGTEAETVFETDVPRGTFLFEAAVPKYGCAVRDFLDFIPDHDRTVSEKLEDVPQPPPAMLLLTGTAPQSFQYVRPTFVLFDGAQQCDKPVGTPLPSQIAVQNERDAYYVQMRFTPPASSQSPPPQDVVALRLRTPTGLHHYIRVKLPFPPPWGGWPGTITFDVRDDELASLATEPAEVLLCPKLWSTSAG